MSQKNINEYRLEVGNHVTGILCPSGEYAGSLADYFGAPSSVKEPDVILQLNIVVHDDEIEIPESLFTAKKVDGRTFVIGDGVIRGEIASGPAEIRLWVKKGLMIGQRTRVFEQILYQAFYSCRMIRQSNAVLAHCSGVLFRKDGFMFAGPSGSGKSTIASLSRGHHVLNDEICLLEFGTSGITIHGTPFNGFFKDKKGGSAPLKAVFLLGHGASHTISSPKEADAIPLLAKEIVPPVALHEQQSVRIFIAMMDTAEAIYRSVPVYRLDFLPDAGFWDEIDRLFYSGMERTTT
ncbi:MAG: hypothetical protein JW807_03975 [Spirochaetes bacterium]|nr:hypothetical protein [Spirochaetota bacterium]